MISVITPVFLDLYLENFFFIRKQYNSLEVFSLHLYDYDNEMMLNFKIVWFINMQNIKCPRGEMVDTKDLKGEGYSKIRVSDSLR